MKLTIKERFQLCEILPRTFSLEEYATKKSILAKVRFTEKEKEDLGIVLSPLSGITWSSDHADDVFDIDLTSGEEDFLTASAGELDKNKQITDFTIDICQRLLQK